MNEDTKRKWDVWLGILAPVLTVGGILVGVWQFNTGEDNRRALEREASLNQLKLEMKKSDLEYRRLLRQTQLQTYSTVATLAGQIAASPQGPKRNAAVQAFEGAYWGTMVMVEDKAVQQAMRDFHEELGDRASGWSQDPNRLKVRADLLAAAFRKSLEVDAAATAPSTP